MKHLVILLLVFGSAHVQAQDWVELAKQGSKRNFFGNLFQYNDDDVNKCVLVNGAEHHILEVLIDNNSEGIALIAMNERRVDYEKTCGGNTILMHAIDAGNLELIKRIINKGASLETENEEGHNAIEYAKASGNTSIYGYLQTRQ